MDRIRNLVFCSFWIIAALVFGNEQALSDDRHVVVIETRIKPEGIASFEAGMKSNQKLIVDFSNSTIQSTVTTGVTTIGFDFRSIRDRFSETYDFLSANRVQIKARGETASAVQLMPNINYDITINLNHTTKQVWLNGCHDGFPSYAVFIDSVEVYSYSQSANPGELLGTCDTEIDPRARSF